MAELGSARSLSIFGATGSIGASALKLLRAAPERFQVDTVSAQSDVKGLLAIAKETRARCVVIGDEGHAQALRDALPDAQVLSGVDGLMEAAAREVEICLNAVIGAAGVPVSFAAIGKASTLALANKETLVCAGDLLMARIAASKTVLIPVDSEHSAIFQCLIGQDRAALTRVILTASGGPFREWSIADMKQARLEDALAHPSWDMGARITIDSASMFNKALEMIEAKHLFALAPAQIDVVVHPQSIVHSLVEFEDMGQLAQLGTPDMRHAISFAMNYPRRAAESIAPLDLTAHGALSFFAPDEERFPALRLAREAMAEGGVAGAALNAAKEIALDGFMNAQIGFLDMAEIVEAVLNARSWQAPADGLDAIYAADQKARILAQTEINKRQ